MIISSSQGYKVDSSKTQKITCNNCRNNSDHELYEFPKGLQLSFIWIPQKYKLCPREYYLKCLICDN